MTTANKCRKNSRRKSKLKTFRPICEALEDRRLLAAGPRIIASSIQPGEVVAAGDVDVLIQFDQEVVTAGLDSADIRLTSERFGDRDFAALDYDVNTQLLSVSYLQLGEDNYTLTLSSAGIRDLQGNELDGEIEGFIGPDGVSGDGEAGGDFVLQFSTDILTQAFPTPLDPVVPLGSLVYRGTTSAELSNGDDEDRFTIEVDAPQSMTIIARSAAISRPIVSLFQDDATLLGTASAFEDGVPAVLSAAQLPSAGEYTIAVGSDDGTGGQFDLQVVLNAAAELELFGGARNDSAASAQDLNAALVGLGDGSVEQVAVFGTAESSLLDLSPTVIATGSVWQYLDDGSNQGTAWREPTFDDNDWDSGAAELGYGDGDETTVVDFVTTASGKNITTYFRQAFQLDDDPARFFEAALRLKRDDGAAVYLNGVEILRDNLAANAAYNQPAATAATGADESEFHEFLIELPPGVLQNGENVMAVEVHQESGESPDLSFDLEMEIFATVPGETNVDAPVFVAKGSVWSYLDDGSNQGTAWRQPGFDDGSWSSGPAILGYGNENVSTTVDFGPNAQQKYATTYFRHRFDVDDPTRIEDLFLELVRDDGAAVYLNGFEIARDNLRPNAAFDDRAFADADEPTVRVLIDLPSLPDGVLRQGENVLAVEVHQSTRNSPDMFFDLSLRGFSSEAERRDWYRLSLQDGETATIGLKQLSEGDVRLNLYDAGGATRLATGYGTDNVDQLISNFTDLTSDGGPTDYLLQVDGDGVQYNLFATLGAEFDAEPNRSLRDAQPSTSALGGLTASGPGAGTLLTDFAGIDSTGDFCDCEPPDPHVSVGPDHIVEVVNTSIAIYNRDGTIVSPPQYLGDFLSPEVVANEGFIFDPVITYDELVDRWVFAVAIGAVASAPETDVILAVSDTSDPTGPWTEQQRIDFGGISPGLFADFPRLGWNADAYVISLNMFDAIDFVGINVVAVQKSTALDADPSTNSHFISERSGPGFTLVPAIMRDAVPGDPMWLVETEDPLGGDSVRVVRMTNVLSSTPNYSDFEVAVTPYAFPLKSPFSLGNFNVNDIRMVSAEWRSDRLVATHTVGEETSARWYEFETSDITPTLIQEATIDPGPGVYTFYPSIAINESGDIGLTYLQASNRQFVEMYVTGHVAGTPPGTMVHPILVKSSDKSYTGVRGGDYSGISVDPVTDTFWVANEIVLESAENPLWSTWLAEFTVADNLDDDWYTFPVEAGSQLVVSAIAPGSAAGEPTNVLGLAIELFDPDGVLVATGIEADDAVQVVYDPTVSGDYRVRVYSENDTQGAYYLNVDSTVDENPAPQVAEVIPIDGLRVNAFPASVTLEMSEAILLDSISREDVSIGGQPALSMTILDGRTFEFVIDPTVNVGDGEYFVELSAGAVVDLAGTGNIAHLSSFILDQTGPRIVDTVWNGKPYPPAGVIAPGPLTLTAEFDEPLFTLSSARKGLRTPGTDDVKITNTLTGEESFPRSMEFDPVANTISVHFEDIVSGEYELRFISGNGAFEDLVGNDLDGEPATGSLDGTPSGDGIFGGDWFTDLTVDLSEKPLGDFVRLDPLGGHVATQTITSSLGLQKLDRYEVFAEAGEVVTAIVTPSDPNALLYLNDGSSSSPGAAASQVATADANGLVNLDVTGSVATDYTLEIFLNSAVEAAIGDSSPDSALSLADFSLPIGSGVVSVVGTVHPSFDDVVVFSEDFAGGLGGFVIDIDYGQGGGLWHLSTGRSQDGNPNHSPPNSLYYGRNEDENGGGDISSFSGHAGAVDSPSFELPESPRVTLSFQYLTGRGQGQRSRDDVAAVEVDDGSGFVTILTTVDDSLDMDTSEQWRTATADLTAFAGSAITLRFTYDTGEATGQNDEGWYVDDISVLAEMVLVADVDAYSIDLSQSVGEPVNVILAGINQSDASDVVLELLDPTGAVAAVGSNMPLASPADGFDLAIVDYIVPDVGDNLYTLRILSAEAGEYDLLVARSLRFGLEPNEDAQDTLQLIDTSSLTLGFLDVASDPLDSFLVTLPTDRPVLMRVAASLNHPQSQPENSLASQFSFAEPASPVLPENVERINLPDTGVVLTAPENVDVQVGITAESGLGEYLWEVDVAALDGDFNDDGTLDCTDLDGLTSAMVTGDDMSFDVSADGSLDADDFLLWQIMASRAQFGVGGTYQPGDANLDGTVDGLDFEIWSTNRFAVTGGWCNGDFNIDGHVDVSDFNIWNDNRFVAAAASLADRTARGLQAAVAVPAVVQAIPASTVRFDMARRTATAVDAVLERPPAVFEESGIVQSELRRHRSRQLSRRLAVTRGEAPVQKAVQSVHANLIDQVFSREWIDL